MAQATIHHGPLIPTLATSYISAPPSSTITPDQLPNDIEWHVGDQWRNHAEERPWWQERGAYRSQGLGSTGKGILIGMLSAFGSAALVALIIAVVYFFRYTNRGRIFLDRISRPGEFDDEQQFLREEEEALAEMDDLQRAEYRRAKGEPFADFRRLYGG